MTMQELIDYYGSEIKVAAAIGMSHQTIKNWVHSQVIPRTAQLAIQTISKGKLKADEECFK